MLLLLPALLMQSGWKIVSPKGAAYSISMPANIESSTSSYEKGGVSLKFQMYIAKEPAAFYQFTVMRPSRALSAKERLELVQGFDSTYLKSFNGKKGTRVAGKLGAYPGHKTTFTVGANKGEYWTILWKNNLYIVTALALAGDLNGVKKPFMSSLKLR